MQSVRAYHERTKHSLASVQTGPRGLDWANQPIPYKIYRTRLDTIPLPRTLPISRMPALEALRRESGVPTGSTADAIPDLPRLAALLHYAAGITRTRRYGQEVMAFRAAACTGALYHIDLYVACRDLPGLPAGVYHYDPRGPALERLRAGDHRAHFLAAAADAPALARAPVVVACASTVWRNAWKYRARAYRHCFWDTGTILANLLAVAAAHELPAGVVTGFVDDAVVHLLGLDADREFPIALVGVGADPAARPPAPPAAAPLNLEVHPPSPRPIDYPEIRAAHAVSSLGSPEAVRRWREGGLGGPISSAPSSTPGGQDEVIVPMSPPLAGPEEPIERVIERRGSARRFAPGSIPTPVFGTLLDCALRPLPLDAAGGAPLTESAIIVHAVEGLLPGVYRAEAPAGRNAAPRLIRLRTGRFRREAGFLALGQALAAEAALNWYFLSDLDVVLDALGDRGYRAAQLDGAIRGGRVYLAAYALGLGATGLTFFDDDVTRFLAPERPSLGVMFLVAAGPTRGT